MDILWQIPVNTFGFPEGSRCMCTGWAFYPRVGEWVTRRELGRRGAIWRFIVHMYDTYTLYLYIYM